MKVYIVTSNDEENYIYHVASSQILAEGYIKYQQMKEMEKDFSEIRNDRRRRPNKYLHERFEDPHNLHPYDIDEQEIDEAWS